MRYGTKWPGYAREWDSMIIRDSRVKEFEGYASYAIRFKSQYMSIAAKAKMLWAHIAVIHRRESDGDFSTYLGNGDPLNRRTVNVPAGRGPFPSFEAGALDALRLDGLTNVLDWRLEKILYYCELFNGAGYDLHGRPSPYIWGGTNIQVQGKYVSDGRWNPYVWDMQPGCAPLLATIARLDQTVQFTRED